MCKSRVSSRPANSVDCRMAGHPRRPNSRARRPPASPGREPEPPSPPQHHDRTRTAGRRGGNSPRPAHRRTDLRIGHMSTDRPALPATAEPSRAVEDSAVARNIERAVLMGLPGRPLSEATLAERIEPADLEEAVEIYRQAGRHALEQQAASGWWQLYMSTCSSPTGTARNRLTSTNVQPKPAGQPGSPVPEPDRTLVVSPYVFGASPVSKWQ